MCARNLIQKEALFWTSADEGRVRCELCPTHCSIAIGEVGRCRVRRNEAGKLYAVNYAQACSVSLDPIEKKPLFHFFPGRPILSLGTVGCNLSCRFCQNWQISQEDAPTQYLSSQEAVRLALQHHHNLGLAYTYNEPFIWYEYVLDTARLAHAAGLKNVLVTNGYVEEKPLRELLPYIDAVNVDIKAMRDDFYKELAGGRARPPRRTVEIAQERCHAEVTNLVIPGWNDTDEDFQSLTDWLAGVNPNIALHFSRYHPCYQMTEPATPLETLLRAREIAQQKLPYVYLGNIMLEGAEDTICTNCKETIVKRDAFVVDAVYVQDGKCRFCGTAVPIMGT
jgi:pyruvate formate lyase activating enzyme